MARHTPSAALGWEKNRAAGEMLLPPPCWLLVAVLILVLVVILIVGILVRVLILVVLVLVGVAVLLHGAHLLSCS